MEVQLVRLNRPLMVANENHRYKVFYGFQIQDDIKPADPGRLYHYIGYLAGIHCISNGDDSFTISYERRGVPDWKDKSGVVHIKQDDWLRKMQERCRKKLNLTYDVITLDADEEDLEAVLDEDGLIIDEEFYYDLAKPQAGKQIISGEKYDGLPF